MKMRRRPLEPEIVSRAQEGDPAALDQILYRTAWLAQYWGKRYLFNQNAIDDIIQDCTIKVYENFQKYDPKHHIGSWLGTIVRNTYKDAYRRRKTVQEKKVDTDVEKLGHYQPPAENVDSKRMCRTALMLMEKLPVNYRSAVLLRDVEGFSYKEIAHCLGMPLGTVKTHVHRGREQIKKGFKNYSAFIQE